MTRDPRPLRERLEAPQFGECERCGDPSPVKHEDVCGRPHSCPNNPTSPWHEPTVKRATLWGEILDTHATERELNGFRESQGRML